MIWDFIQSQVLGMKWLNELIGVLLKKVGLDISGKLGGSIHFFIYDVIKITILLCTLIYVISYIQSYFPAERSKKILGRFKSIGANCISALLGTVTPFCSCSSIPLFIGFTSAGLPLGVTFSFLISSPMVDLGSLVLLMSIFGTKVAVSYVVVGLIIAVVSGTLIEKMHMEKYVEEFILNANSVDIDSPTGTCFVLENLRDRVHGDKVIRRTNYRKENDIQKYTKILKEDFGNMCGYCGKDFNIIKCPYQKDHLIPEDIAKKVGRLDLLTDYNNLVYSCRVCNRNKWNN